MRHALLTLFFAFVPTVAAAASADALVEALDLPAAAVVSASTSGLDDQSRVIGALGPIGASSGDMALFTTGYASQVHSGEDHDLGTSGYDPTEPSSPVHDQALLELELTVPEGMHSLKFDWYFLSREYPYYVGSDYNDRFTVVQEGALFDGNIVFDDGGNVVDVNNALFTVADALSLEGTGFWRESGVSPTGYDGGGTGWVTTQSPVEPGETVTLRFDVHDVADGVYDSGVLVDHFRWSEEEVDDPVTGAPLELHWLSPKSGSIEGGDEVLVSGRRFTMDTDVFVGGVAATSVEVLGDGVARIVIPAAPDGAPALVDVVARNEHHEATLTGGFSWVRRSVEGAPPEATSVDPTHAEADSGAEIEITGAGFDAGTVVTFGEVQAEVVEVVSSTALRVTLPAMEAGAVAVRVKDAAGRSGGRPVPFVARGERAGPKGKVSPVPAGCDAGGGGAAPSSLLLLLGMVVIFRWRRPEAAALVVAAALLTGCTSDHVLRPGDFDHPVAVAAIVDAGDEVDAATVAVGSRVEITGARSSGDRGAVLDWHWAVVEAPAGAEVELEATGDRASSIAFRPSAPGTYLLQLVVTDHRTRASHPAAVLVQASDGEAVRVRLEWDAPGHDLDLHVAREGYFGDGDCFFGRPDDGWGARYDGDADGTEGAMREDVVVTEPGSFVVYVHHLNDRGSLAEVEAVLTLFRDGEEVSLPLEPEALVQGEVWQAFSVAVPGGEAMIDQVTTHEALGGPPVNERADSGS